MFKVEGNLYPHREYWQRSDREFFVVVQGEADEDPEIEATGSIRIWLEDAMINYTTEWEPKGRKFFVFQRRIDAIRFCLAWLK